jgi:hypothetical protein
MTAEQEIRAISLVEMQKSRDENVQVNGYVFIVDFTGFSMSTTAQWSMDDTKKWSRIWQVNKFLVRFVEFWDESRPINIVNTFRNLKALGGLISTSHEVCVYEVLQLDY